MKKALIYPLALSILLTITATAQADDYVITIKNNQFTPKVLTVPAGKKIKITVKNEDATPAEFESSDLNREKAIAAKGEISLFIGPLDAGTYSFLDDFHRDTTTGTIIAK